MTARKAGGSDGSERNALYWAKLTVVMIQAMVGLHELTMLWSWHI